MVGVRADLARVYNLERAKFLRGEVERIADSAPKFAAEIGFFDAVDERKDKFMFRFSDGEVVA